MSKYVRACRVGIYSVVRRQEGGHLEARINQRTQDTRNCEDHLARGYSHAT